MARPRLVEHADVVALHDIDLKEALHKLGIYDEIVGGVLSCMICEDKVNLDNLGALIRINGKIKVICDKPTCISTVIKMSKALKE